MKKRYWIRTLLNVAVVKEKEEKFRVKYFPWDLYIKVGKSENGEYSEEFWRVDVVGRGKAYHLVSPYSSIKSKEEIVDVLSGDIREAIREFIRRGYHKKDYYLVSGDGTILKVRPKE